MRNFIRLMFSLAAASTVVTTFGQNYTISTVAGGGTPVNVPAGSASLGPVRAVATDSAGNVYTAITNSTGTYSLVIQISATSGTTSLVAGSDGSSGFSGDSGPAASSHLASPSGIAVDTAGNIYIADTGNNRVRKISGGVITTVAGGGSSVIDGVLATAEALTAPTSVAVDAAGNLYIGETNRVRKVSGGVISTVAGTGVAGFSGDNGSAIAAQLNNVVGVAVDSGGSLYIADSGNLRIRKVSSAVITTIAGNGVNAASADGTPAASAALNGVNGLTVDTSGFVYVSELARVRKIAGGAISTVAGIGSPGYAGDGLLAITAQINNPQGLAVDAAGNLFIADSGNNVIRRVAASGALISTFAGNGSNQFGGDGGPATGAQLNAPNSTALDAAGNFYITEAVRVRKVSTAGIITTVAGGGTLTPSAADGGSATSASMMPVGIAVDAAGTLYIADAQNNSVRKVVNGIITTIAGTGFAGYSGDNGSATLAQLNSPHGVAVDASGIVYVSDTNNHRIRRISAGVISTIVGTGFPGTAGDGGSAGSAQIAQPWGIAVDTIGNLYIAEYGSHKVRKVSAGVITTLAGTGTAGFSGDGVATLVNLNAPQSVGVDSSGNVYVSDSGNYRVRKISGTTLTTIGGTGVAGFTGDGGPATTALEIPLGIAVNSLGNVYVAEGSSRVRLLSSGATSCSFVVTPITLPIAATGGNAIVTIQTTAGCAWTITGLPTFVAVAGPLSGSGPATITLVVSPNPGAARSAPISIAGTTVTVSQSSNSSCSYALSLNGQSFPAAGGNGSVGLTASPGCAWTASSTVSWITITGTSTGTGNGTITYQVAANTAAARTGTLSIAGLTYTVQQVSVNGTGGIVSGSLAQLAADGAWRTQFTLINTGTVATSAKLSFFDNNGNPLNLNLSFPASPGQGTVIGPAIEQIINPGAELVINTSGPDNQPLVVGWAQFATSGSVSGFATFQQTVGATVQEAVVPLETRNPASFLISYDNSSTGATGIAIANIAGSQASIPVTIRDDQGNILLSALTTLPAQGHNSFDVAGSYPVTAGKRGTIQFDTPAGGQLTVLGLHFNVTGAFSTIPAVTK